MEKKEGVQDIADKVLKANKTQRQGRQFMLWILALVVGAALGWLGIKPLNELFTFIATVFTRLFQFYRRTDDCTGSDYYTCCIGRQ